MESQKKYPKHLAQPLSEGQGLCLQREQVAVDEEGREGLGSAVSSSHRLNSSNS